LCWKGKRQNIKHVAMNMEELEVDINSKVIKLKGKYVGHLFCVDGRSVDNHPMLTNKEKESLKKDFRSNKNILLTD